MVRINLLPVREINRRAKAKQQVTLFVFALLFFLVLLAIAGFIQSSKAKQLQQELSGINQEKQKYTIILNQIKQLEADKSILEKHIDVIKKLKAESSLTVRILDEVANNTPTNRMWLSSLTQSGNTLQLSGMALDNRTIAQYMESLQQSPYIQNVNLDNSSLKAFAGRNLKSFSLSCTIGIPVEKKETVNQENSGKS